jgi:uncharacterized protein (TIGR02118 family)
MPEVTLHALYPYPLDTEKFDRDYEGHLRLLHARMQIPADARPYTVTRFIDLPQGRPAFYQMFVMTFPSAEALRQAMASKEMQEVAADAARISTGGAPVILVGS